MKMLSVLQLIEIFLAYFLITFLPPFFVLRRKLKTQSLSVRFMIYCILGNFYVINLVFLLQLLHISNRFTLIFFTVVPAIAAMIKINHLPVRETLEPCFESTRRFLNGQVGVRSQLEKTWFWIGKELRCFGKWCQKVILKHSLDWILVFVVTALVFWIYGSNMFRTYGYCASDIPVHNYWINYMSKDCQIFVDGVYPFGFHCVIYYLHTVFGIATYTLLRLFWVVQTLLVHYMLFAFLKGCCRSKFLPYAGAGIYAVSSQFSESVYMRFYSSLPQEFGMIFILPSIYFLFAYFEKRKAELDDHKMKRRANWYLVGFAISFSLTLAVHFYGTMIAGLFCLGIGVGYGFRFFRKKYFFPVLLAGVFGVIIAILPMGIAYVTGTPLQGSLKWGMSVVSSGEEVDHQQKEHSEKESSKVKKEDRESVVLYKDLFKEWSVSFKNRMKTKAKDTWDILRDSIDYWLSSSDDLVLYRSICGGMACLLIVSILLFILKQQDYGARILSTVCFMVFMSVLLMANKLGLPELMDSNRCAIFYAYMVPIVWVFCADACLTLLLGWVRFQWMIHVVSFALVCGIGFYMTEKDLVKDPLYMEGFETNSAITCLTNILHNDEEKTWTICSANDELRMCEEYGYHYETIKFLRNMEYKKGEKKKKIVIPTNRVYFFIEKIPLDYSVTYENSGQKISKKGADRKLPVAEGLGIYQGENRWVVMSRMYSWARAFQQKYPNEMKVYYESDEFICYRIEQNTYSFYNFAIDYGYNTKTYGKK
ncbi:MAG: hypothetical protein HFI37_02660 [Lachnospiraceae bacterium]|nr:hypothetical protein [Lachnospiraceae bacterium]